MSKFVVTVHMGGGSMAEGMQPTKCFGMFTHEEDADEFATAFYEICRPLSKTLAYELLTCVSEVELPVTTTVYPDSLEVPEGHQVVDVSKCVETWLTESGYGDLVDEDD